MRTSVFWVLSLLLSVQMQRAAVAADMEVVVGGVGRTVQSATVQAGTNAIRAVLGAALPLEILVRQEAQVRALLEQAGDFVLETVPLGDPVGVDEGLSCLTVRVRVNSAALQAALQQKGLAVARLDGLSLVTAHETRVESREDAGQIAAEALRPLPAGALRATAQVRDARHKLDGKTMRVELPVSVTVDLAAYATMLDGLRATLGKLGIATRVVNLSGTGSQQIVQLWKEVGLPDALKQKEGPSLLAVCELIAEKSSRWSLSVVPAQVAAAFGKDSAVVVKVDLLDAAGVAVTSRDFSLGGSADKKSLANIFAYAPFFRTAGVAPVANALNIEGGVLSLPQSREAVLEHVVVFNLGMEELRQISNVRCTVTNKAK